MDRRSFFLAAVAGVASLPALARAHGEQDFCTYRGSILAVSSMMTWFYDEATRLTSTDDPTVFADEAWRTEVLATFALPRATQTYLQSVDAPDEFDVSHDLLSQAVDASVTSGEFFTAGLLNNDPASIQLAAEYLGDSTDLIVQATAALPD